MVAKQRDYRVSFFAGADLPSVQQINAVFSWRVLRATSVMQAVLLALAEDCAKDYAWCWSLVKVGKSPDIHAVKLEYKPNQIEVNQ